MFVSKEFRFEASHILPQHPGKCRNLHGHSWRVVVEVDGDLDPRTNFLLDFYELGQLMNPLIECLDHTHLNYLLPYPTSEVLALALMNVLKDLECFSIQAVTIRVSETQKTWASATVQDIWGMNDEDAPIGAQDAALQKLIGMPTPEEIIMSSIVNPPVEEILAKQAQWRAAIFSAQNVAAGIKASRKDLIK